MKNETHNTPNNPAINAAFVEASKAAKSATAADTTLTERATQLVALDINADDIGKGGRYLAYLQSVAAETNLTSKEFTVWGDESLAQGKSVEGKREDTQRGKLVKRVNAYVKRIRDKVKSVQSGGTGPKEASTPTEAFFKAIDGYITRFSKEDASDRFEFDPRTARTALMTMIKDLK